MEAEIPSPGLATGVPGPLRGVAGSRKSKLIAAARDRAGGIERTESAGTEQLDLHSESHRRCPRLVATDRGGAAGALPRGAADRPVVSISDDFGPQRSSDQHQKIGHHVRVLAGLSQRAADLSVGRPAYPADAVVADVEQTTDEVLRSPLHGRDHSRQQQTETRPKAEEGRYLPLDLQELRHDPAGHTGSRGEETVTPG